MKRIIRTSTLALLVVLTLTGCKKSYTITVKSNNTEWGSVTGSGTYKDGETATLSAVPAVGCCFVRWNDGDATNPRQIVVSGDAEYIAIFTDTTGSGNDLTGTVVHDAVTDYDGNSYDAVWIGNQLWMKENLHTTHYADGTEIPHGIDTSVTKPYWYNYSVLTLPQEKYYNWPAVMHGEVSSNTSPSGVQGICPSGWHLPSDAEWLIMEQRLSTMDVSGFGWRGDHAGMLASDGWDASSKSGAPGNVADSNHNISGFSAVSVGYCNSIAPIDMGRTAHFWSATQDIHNSAWCRDLFYNEARVNRDLSGKESGYSVRCLRN